MKKSGDEMKQKNFAFIGGIVMLIIGILAFYPGFNKPVEGLPELNVEASYGLFLNAFPMNIFNKLAFIILGIIGITVSAKERTVRSAIIFIRTVFWFMCAFTILGVFRQTNTLFGYWPLFGNEIWFHAVFAMLAGYFGYNAAARTALESQYNEKKMVL